MPSEVDRPLLAESCPWSFDTLNHWYWPFPATHVGARRAGDTLVGAVARMARSYSGNSAFGR